MERTRRAVLAALCVALSAGGAVLAATGNLGVAITAAVAWPPSTLLVSEIQTGGASASDEFAEITNVGGVPVDLAGLEIVYVTSTGSTVTRKAAWTGSVVLEPGRHLFIANSLGVYAGLADATYSGGFAATGGAIVLRAVGGAPVDAVGWGDATNSFVESAAVGAPAAGTSVERRPAGLAGNTTDTNDNAADFLAQPAPNPQSLAAPPVPAPGPTTQSSPTASIAPTASLPPTESPAPSSTALPTSQPSATPAASPVPSVEPSPEPSVEASAAPTETPTPTIEPSLLPTASPSADPTVAPTPEATPVPTASLSPAISILAARGLADGAAARIEGMLTTQLGGLESGRKAFVQDGTAGIAVYLDAAAADGLAAGTLVSIVGTLDERFAERTLRAALTDVAVLGDGQLPTAIDRPTGDIGEASEGLRVLVRGVSVGTPSELADGLGLMIDDGSGAVRVIVGPAALGSLSVPSGTTVTAIGPAGQRDSSGTGLAGYRIHTTVAGEFAIVTPPQPSATPAPNPTPTITAAASAAPTPTAAPTPAPSRTPAPTPSPTATPGPTPATVTLAEARAAPVGTTLTVAGVVTAEAGRIGLPPLLAIADSTGGIVVRLPDGALPPPRGSLVVVRGPLADPYGQLELRPSASGYSKTGQGSLPAPLRLHADDLGEATEGRLAELTGTVASAPQKGTSGNVTVDLTDAAGRNFRVVCDASSGIDAAAFVKARSYRLTGIVGQRASRKGALDGYRLYLRDPKDMTAVATGPGPGGSSSAVPIATALAYADETAAVVEGSVTAPASLLDSTGRRIVIQDTSGAIEVLLPIGSESPAVGTRLRVTGKTGHAYGAPRIGATKVESLGKGSGTSPMTLGRPPAKRDEWRLVRLSGTVEDVERMGDRWRAEIKLVNGGRAPVHGQAGAGIASTAIVEGRTVTVIGIVRRPYPTASDRRFAVLPRGSGDLALGPASGGAGGGGTGGGQGPAGVQGGGSAASPAPTGIDITPDTDLAALADHVGERVRVGGLIARLTDDGFELDDGTALAQVRLRGSMSQLLPNLRVGEAIAATGKVELDEGVAMVVVGDDGTLFRVGSLGQALPIAEDIAPGASEGPGVGGSLEADATVLGPDLGSTSALTLAGLALLSLAATLARRQMQRRRLRAALVARLAGLRGDAASAARTPAPGAAPSAEVVADAPANRPAAPSRAGPPSVG